MSSTESATTRGHTPPGTPSARLEVVTGPQRGMGLDLTEDILHIGQTADCALQLQDPLLSGRLVSVCLRNGRHAIYVTGTDEVEVDATRIPPDRWVWMPRTCSIQLTRRTTLEFQSLVAVTDVDYDAQPAGALTETLPASARKSRAGTIPSPPVTPTPPAEETGKRTGKKGDSKSRSQVARFLTDQAGDPLVKLGEDGHLPELQLQEGAMATKSRPDTEESATPVGLIAAFCVSVGLSLLMLFVDLEGGGGSNTQASAARQVLAIFYATEENGNTPEPYQLLLRRAQQAHTRNDLSSEKALYREVLRLLRAENRGSLAGVTRLPAETQRKFDALSVRQLQLLGGPTESFLDLKNDERLERVLSILLRE